MMDDKTTLPKEIPNIDTISNRGGIIDDVILLLILLLAILIYIVFLSIDSIFCLTL